MRTTVLAVALALMGASAYGQIPPSVPVTPDFRVQIWGSIGSEFERLVLGYADLRRELEVGLTALAVTDDPAEIRAAELALARRVRAARGPRQGALFTPEITTEFRKVLLLQVTEETLIALMDDNPGDFSHRINGSYPKDKPVSTVPANLLGILPALPEDIQYRFLGRNLILLDVRANVILDRISCAVDCTRDR